MYTPQHFEMIDVAQITNFIRAHSFGILMSSVDGEPFATHVPFLYDSEQNVLLAHMARANPQWRNLDGQAVLVVFSGPHAYISPTWYREPASVPTWNYSAVHVYGRGAVMDHEEELAGLLRKTVRYYEPDSELPTQADEPFYRNMLRAIVGFRIEVTRVEGKAKLSQNKSMEVRKRVVEHLLHSTDAGAHGVAGLMQEQLSPSKEDGCANGHTSAVGRAYLDCALENFRKMKSSAERAIDQLSLDELNFAPNEESNSVARIVKHMAGNMVSRWTDFLTSDGEKPARARDREFEGAYGSREELLTAWNLGWERLFDAIVPLTQDDLLRTVYIRTEPHTVIQAVERQVSHLSSHVGQIIYLAKQVRNSDWDTLSIPRGGSQKYLDTMAKRPT